jgi:hypothetical protein
MKKMLTFISWAWQSLKYWCDPAMEGDPYVREEKEKSYSISITRRLLKNLN